MATFSSRSCTPSGSSLLLQSVVPEDCRADFTWAGVAPGLTLESPVIDTARLRALQAATPLQRGVSPDDVAHAVRYVLESPAVTGSTLLVDAGSHLVRQPRDWAYADPAEARADASGGPAR